MIGRRTYAGRTGFRTWARMGQTSTPAAPGVDNAGTAQGGGHEGEGTMSKELHGRVIDAEMYPPSYPEQDPEYPGQAVGPTGWYEVMETKAQRLDIDAIIQRVKAMPPSRERSLAITKLQEGVMWLGMELKRQGEANPYPNSKDPTSPVIDKTADGLKL